MGAGDFFGEIAALTGSARTADVVVTQPTTLMEVPAETLRAAMEVPEVNQLMTSTVTERLQRTNQPDLPRLASMDRSALRQLRTQGAVRRSLAFGVHGRLRTPRHRPGRARWTATRRLLNDGRRSMSRMRRGEPVPLSPVRVLRDVTHAARRGLGHLSGVRVREPGRLPLLRLLRDRARPSRRARREPQATPLTRHRPATGYPRGPGGPSNGRRGRRPTDHRPGTALRLGMARRRPTRAATGLFPAPGRHRATGRLPGYGPPTGYGPPPGPVSSHGQAPIPYAAPGSRWPPSSPSWASGVG